MNRRMITGASAALVAGLLAVSSASAQVTINARAGIGLPTGGIADSDNSVLMVGAETGFDVGGGFGFMLNDRLELRANADFSFHSTEGAAGAGPDVDVSHFIAGLGVLLTNPGDPFYVSVNAGAGLLSFNFDTDALDTETYFAINAGAEIGYWVSDNVAIFASPQGDIAFSDEDVVGTSTSLVWPLTGGLKVKIGS